MDFSDFERIVR